MAIISKIRELTEPQPVTRKMTLKGDDGEPREVDAYAADGPGHPAFVFPEEAITGQDDRFVYVKLPRQIIPLPLQWVKKRDEKSVTLQTPQGIMTIPADAVAGQDHKMLFLKAPAEEAKIPLDDIVSTQGNLPAAAPARGAFSGGLQGGYASGFPALSPLAWGPAMAGGIFGGYAGVKEGERTGSLWKGLETGASVGAAAAGATAAASLALAAALGTAGPAIPVVLAGLFLASRIFRNSPIARKIAKLKPVRKAAEGVKKLTAGLAAWMPPCRDAMEGKSRGLDRKLHGHLGAAAATALLAALALTQPHLALPLLYAGFSGGLAGSVGTYAGTRLSNVRDREYGGYLLGLMARHFFPIDPLAAAAASPLGSEQQSKLKQVLAAFVPGLALGALSGAAYGPEMAAISGILSGAVSAAGTLFGPKFMQAIRNINAKISQTLTQKFDSKTREKSNAERITKACIGGALMYGMFGIPAAMIFGPVGAAIPALAGAIYYGAKVHSQIEKEKTA